MDSLVADIAENPEAKTNRLNDHKLPRADR
jgi:hypothetical protein